MLILSYNVSSHLKESLSKIEELRKQLLLTPLSPTNQQRLIWESKLERIYWSLSLMGAAPNRDKLIEILSKDNRERLPKTYLQALNYKSALDYIYLNWTVNGRPVSPITIQKIHRLVSGSSSTLSKQSKKSLKHFLNYLHTGNEHPIIQAGIAQIQMINIAPFPKYNLSLSNLLMYLFLYKQGYDLRQMLVYEEFLKKDLVLFQQSVERITRVNNLTTWLEYFTQGIEIQLGKAVQAARTGRFKTSLHTGYWKLNKRQQKILIFLETPGKKITNMDVQKMFKTSQITASRDLSKLASLNYLFAHGKGRSVFYTKV